MARVNSHGAKPVAPKPALPDAQIGYLEYTDAGDMVLGCLRCARRRLAPVYRVNVYPYRGTCDRCGTTLVEPATPAWPELFGRSTFDARLRLAQQGGAA